MIQWDKLESREVAMRFDFSMERIVMAKKCIVAALVVFTLFSSPSIARDDDDSDPCPPDRIIVLDDGTLVCNEIIEVTPEEPSSPPGPSGGSSGGNKPDGHDVDQFPGPDGGSPPVKKTCVDQMEKKLWAYSWL